MPTAQTELTQQEIARAEHELAASRAAFLEAVTPITDQQWKFHAAPGSWSPAEIAEHIGAIQQRVHHILSRIPESAQQCSTVDENALFIGVRDRLQKVVAPDFLIPVGNLTREEAVESFEKAHAQLERDLHEITPLRGRVIPHPIAGNLDGYQWLLISAAHVLRHIKQLHEVTNHPDYPCAT